jgi:amino acid permease
MMLANIRDVAIVILAIESILIGIILIVLVWEVIKLLKFLRKELKPLIDEMRETTNTVKGTTEILSEEIVSPAIKVSSTLAAARGVLKVLKAKVPNKH